MYFVFAGQIYYPSGGWNDYRGLVDNEQKAIELLKEKGFEFDGDNNIHGFYWYQLVDTNLLKEV